MVTRSASLSLKQHSQLFIKLLTVSALHVMHLHTVPRKPTPFWMSAPLLALPLPSSTFAVAVKTADHVSAWATRSWEIFFTPPDGPRVVQQES